MGGNWYEKSVPAHLYFILVVAAMTGVRATASAVSAWKGHGPGRVESYPADGTAVHRTGSTSRGRQAVQVTDEIRRSDPSHSKILIS